MSELSHYLQSILCTSNSKITFSGDRNNYLNRWLIKVQEANPQDMFHIQPQLLPNGRVIEGSELELLDQQEIEMNWKLYCPRDFSRYLNQYSRIQQDIIPDKDKNVYALASIYFREEQEAMVFCATMAPISVWINDELVYSSCYDFFIKETTLIYKFKKGVNLILVEKPHYLRHKDLRLVLDDFVITVKPYDYCLDEKENYFFDCNVFTKSRTMYTIVQNKAVYGEDDKVEVFVLPRYFCVEQEKEDITINVYDDKNQLYTRVDTKTTTKVTLDIDLSCSGIYKIMVDVKGKESTILSNYFVVGDLLELTQKYVELARDRKDIDNRMIENLIQLVSIPNTKIGVIHDSYEMMNSWLYHIVFEKLYEFILYIHKPISDTLCKPRDMYNYFIPAYHYSKIDEKNLFYFVILPKKYDPNKKYPLIMYIEYGYGASSYPSLKEYHINQDFDDTIVINIGGRGGLNNDYINECNVFDMLSEVVEEYNIDRDRMHVIGTCAGSMKGYGLAIKNPSLFAVACAINGTVRTYMMNPDYEQLKNLETMSIYEIASVRDPDFNCSFVIDVFNHIKSSKVWTSNSYSHEDFNESMNSNKLIKKILENVRDRYPKKLHFSTKDAMFNHCYWLYIDRIHDLSKKGIVEIEIISKDNIVIDSTNVSKLSLLLDKAGMNLLNEITIKVNEHQLPITLMDYTKVTLCFTNEKISVNLQKLTKEQYLALFDAIAIDQNLMGIKQLYYRRCRILYSSVFRDKKDSCVKRLIRILCAPLVERNRNYRYEKNVSDEIDQAKLAEGNLIYLASIEDTSELQQKLMEAACCNVTNDKLEYHGSTFYGDTFAIIKCKNPYNPDKNALLVIYNSESIKQELLNIWGTFDQNALFYSEAIIFNKNQYYSFRND